MNPLKSVFTTFNFLMNPFIQVLQLFLINEFIFHRFNALTFFFWFFLPFYFLSSRMKRCEKNINSQGGLWKPAFFFHFPKDNNKSNLKCNENTFSLGIKFPQEKTRLKLKGVIDIDRFHSIHAIFFSKWSFLCSDAKSSRIFKLNGLCGLTDLNGHPEN